MKILIVVEIPEIEDINSDEANNALDIIKDEMQHFSYQWYVDEVIQDEQV
jgi:hypothetical protein